MAAFLFLLASLFLCAESVCGQSRPQGVHKQSIPRPSAQGVHKQSIPRLVVLISYDQYRGDYIDNFRRFVGKRGFERMRNEGATFSKCMYTHANLMTGPGHSILMTGCNPKRTGIPSNDFCDSETGHCMYCVEDFDKGLSPENLLTETFGETLRGFRPASKSVGIAIKDRAAILMAGRNPTAVLWMDFKTHAFTTSPYYKTPAWLRKLNKLVRAERHAGATWKTTIPESMEPAVDDQAGEGTLSSGRRTFPYTIPPVDNVNFFIDYIRTPYNMRDLFDATKAVIKYEDLGGDAAPDVLCIGVSTTDFVGHIFGPDSREVQELYVECDKQLAGFIDYLDKRVGRNRYVLVVTSDHGVAPIPEVIKNAAVAQKAIVDAGRIPESAVRRTVDSALSEKYGAPLANKSWCSEIFEPSVFLADDVLLENKVFKGDAVRVAANALRSLQGIGISVEHDSIEKDKRPSSVPTEIWTYIINSFSPRRSGDILIYPKQYWIFGSNPASHGTPYEYDRHVPLMWLGGGIVPKTYAAEVSPIDIAPTLGQLVGISIKGTDGQELPLEKRSTTKK